jgi:hypothetical protein
MRLAFPPAIAINRTPRFLGEVPFPRPNSAAWLLGRYCSLAIALKTLVLVSADTAPVPFVTRDTVAVETPASRATSFAMWLTSFSSTAARAGVSSQLDETTPFLSLRF